MTEILHECMSFLRGVTGLTVGVWLVLILKHAVRSFVDRAG